MEMGKPEALWCCGDGAGSYRPIIRHLLGRARWLGDGFDLSRWIGRAEAKVAAAYGADGKDRLFRFDRAAGWLQRGRRLDGHRETGTRHLGAQQAEGMERPHSLVRPGDHIRA